MQKQITLYSAAMCSDCQTLKNFMVDRGIEFELRDIKENPEYADEVRENTGKLGVPYLVIDGEWVRGYELDKPFSTEFAESLFKR